MESAEKGVVIDQPTSPEQIDEDAATVITNHSNMAGHQTTLENVKGNQTLKITEDMKKLGVEPSGVEILTGDVIRNIREEIEGGPKGTGVVKGLDFMRLKADKRIKTAKFLGQSGLKKAA